MGQDPLSGPTPPGQINRTSLGQPGAVAEATTTHHPALIPLRFDHEQGAGQAPNRAADPVELQHHRGATLRSGQLQGQHPTTAAPLQNVQLQWALQSVSRCTEGLADSACRQRSRPTKTWMGAAVGPLPLRQQAGHRRALIQGQTMALPPDGITIRLRPQVRLSIHRPGLRSCSHHTTITGVIHSADRLSLPAEQSPLGCRDRLPHS